MRSNDYNTKAIALIVFIRVIIEVKLFYEANVNL